MTPIRNIIVGLLVAFVVGAAAMVSYNRLYGGGDGKVIVNLNKAEADDYAFIDESDVRAIVEAVSALADDGAERQVAESSLARIDLRALEDELKNLTYVKEAQVSRDLKGNLIVDIEQAHPAARIVPQSGEGVYLSSERKFLPLSDRYTARVIMVTGAGADSLFSPNFRQTEPAKALFDLLDYVNADPFWKAQIAQADLDEGFNASLYPLVGDYVIRFGSPENYRVKMAKLKAFYEKVAPVKGWEAYEEINLSYEGQIVGKKK